MFDRKTRNDIATLSVQLVELTQQTELKTVDALIDDLRANHIEPHKLLVRKKDLLDEIATFNAGKLLLGL